MVSQKLYHRRCFRCSKCSGHLNPKNFHIIDSSSFSCDSCKNEKTLPKFVNNNDQIGMLAFDSDMSSSPVIMRIEEPVSSKGKPRPQSILGEQKIKYFNSHRFSLFHYAIMHASSFFEIGTFFYSMLCVFQL